MNQILPTAISTQKELKDRLLVDPNLQKFYWVQALEQTGGRGRQGREWASPLGNLYLSVLVRGPIPEINWVPHRIALAMIESFPLDAGIKIKWPNDLVFINDDRPEKFAGLICEKVDDHFVIGVGINVRVAPNIGRPVTTLGQIFDNEVVLDSVRDKFLEKLTKEFSAPSNFRERYLLNQYFRQGQKIKWDSGDGEFLGIGEYGELLVKLPSGETKGLFSEDVHLLR